MSKMTEMSNVKWQLKISSNSNTKIKTNIKNVEAMQMSKISRMSNVKYEKV